MSKVILIDNGHGNDTPGKYSPVWSFGQLFEWEFNRDLARRIILGCYFAGMRATKIVPEVFDISLKERCRRANDWYDRCEGDCILLSLHANAGGGTGFEVFTSVGETKADALASKLIAQLEMDFPNIRMRKDYSDGDADKESGFYILKHTKCPALLVENLFMDNEKDCRLLLSEDFRKALADSYVKFLKQIV